MRFSVRTMTVCSLVLLIRKGRKNVSFAFYSNYPRAWVLAYHAYPRRVVMSSNTRLPSVTLVLGGARSGKSYYAESLLVSFKNPIYLATAEAYHTDDQDGEMANRIAEHKKRRGPHWRTIEEPINLIGLLNNHASTPVMVDCMTLWLANIMSAGLIVEKELDALAKCLKVLNGPLILVSNEVGQGIIPDNSLARSYADSAGLMNQRLAACADQLVVMHAGIPQILKEV